MAHHIRKVFMNGRSQAIRLPKEFRFEVEQVYIKKMGGEDAGLQIENWLSEQTL